MPCSPQSKIAPKPLFHNKPETTGSASFKVGDRLDLYSVLNGNTEASQALVRSVNHNNWSIWLELFVFPSNYCYLIAGLIDWLVFGLSGCLVDRMIGWLVGCLVIWLISFVIDWLLCDGWMLVWLDDILTVCLIC